MKKLLPFLLLFITLQGCREYCYNCVDLHGSPAGQKCFSTEEEQTVWAAGQRASKPNEPTSCQ